jgi:hypothetical protein
MCSCGHSFLNGFVAMLPFTAAKFWRRLPQAGVGHFLQAAARSLTRLLPAVQVSGNGMKVP